MGEKRRRLKAFDSDTVRPVYDFVNSYMYSLRSLIRSVDENEYDIRVPECLHIGHTAFWPCTDGAVILIVRNEKNEIAIEIKQPVSKNISDFFVSAKDTRLYDQNGHPSRFQLSMSMENSLTGILYLYGMEMTSPDTGQMFKPRWDNAMILGWKAELPKPDEKALEDFKKSFFQRNIIEEESEVPAQNLEQLTKAKAQKLLEEYRSLIKKADYEEEAQRFLSDHPELLYPDHIKCYPKFKLGEDHITDYVLLVHGYNGPEYIFVEIERPNKKIFTNNGQLSAQYTQAKDQLINWDIWVTQNIAYVSKKLPKLHKPNYHLVMGNAPLEEDQRIKIRTDMGGSDKRFSTFMDIANRFEAIMEKLVGN